MAFENILGAKATGKAQSGPVGAQSNIAEQMAQQKTQEQVQDVQVQDSLATASQDVQKDAIKEEGLTQQRNLDQQTTDQESERMDHVQNLLQKAEFSDLELENRQDALTLESTAHQLMMQDESYIHNLREVGRRRGLTDGIKFQEEMDSMVYGEELDMLMDELDWKGSEGQLARDNTEAMYNMNVDIAMAIAAADTKAVQSQAVVGGLTSAAIAGAGAFDKPKEP